MSVQLPPLRTPMPGEGGQEWRVPDPDVYTLEIAEIMGTRQKVWHGEVQEGKFQVRLRMRVVGGEFDGVSWPQWFGYSTHELAPLRGVLIAIRGGETLPPGGDVDLMDYIGKPFRGMVEVDEVPARDDPSRILRFAKVSRAMPVKTAKTSPAAAQAAPPAAAPRPDPNNPFDVDDY